MKTAIVAALLSLAAPAGATTFLAVNGADTTYSEDASTGALTTLDAAAGGGATTPSLIGLAVDPVSGRAFTIDVGGWPDQAMWLVELDTTTGGALGATELSYQGAPVLLAEGLAFDKKGVLWISFGHPPDFQWYESGHLGEVDVSTGAIDPTTVVAMLSYPNADADSLEWVNNTLYMTDNVFGVGSDLYTVDVSTGNTTKIGQVRDASGPLAVTDLAFSGTALYAETYNANGSRLYSISRSTAAATAIGPDHATVYGIAPVESCKKKSCSK